jgi:hypothetical protein
MGTAATAGAKRNEQQSTETPATNSPAFFVFGSLLLGEQLTGVAVPIARVAGIALIALGIACWPGPPLLGMLIYSAAVTLYLAYLGFAGGLAGVFLWPAVALHAALSILLGRAWLATDS